MTGKQAYEHVFLNQCWGNKANAGVNYKRSYNKTKKEKAKNES